MKQSIPIFTTTFALCGVIATAFAAGTPVSGLIPCMFFDQKTQCAAAVPGSASPVTHMAHIDQVTINIKEGGCRIVSKPRSEPYLLPTQGMKALTTTNASKRS